MMNRDAPCLDYLGNWASLLVLWGVLIRLANNYFKRERDEMGRHRIHRKHINLLG